MNKGSHKIKRTKTLYGNKRKNKAKKLLMIIITIVAAALLIFLGYSIGDPLVNFFKNLSSSSPDTTSWAPPESTSDTSTVQTVTEATTAEKENLSLTNIEAYLLETDDILTKESLETALANVQKNGFTSVILPLKARGGYIYYNSSLENVHNAGAVKSELKINDIVEIVDNYDLTAIAQLSILYDNIAPNAEKLIAYQFSDGVSSWYDNNPKSGGKKWISPFSDEGKEYIYSVIDEVLNSDFDAIICSDMIFPYFRQTDLKYIGETVQNPARYKALIDIMNTIADKAEYKGKKAYLQISAERISNESEEVFKPNELNNIDYILNYDINNIHDIDSFLNSDAFLNIIKNVKTAVGNNSNIILIVNLGDNFTPENHLKVVAKLSELNLENYIIK